MWRSWTTRGKHGVLGCPHAAHGSKGGPCALGTGGQRDQAATSAPVRRAPQEAGKRSLSDKGQSWASNPGKPEPKACACTLCHATSRSRRAPGARVSGRGRPPVPMRSSAEGGLSAPGETAHPPDQQRHKGAPLTLTLRLDAQRPSALGKPRQCGPLCYSHKAGFPRACTGWPGGQTVVPTSPAPGSPG